MIPADEAFWEQRRYEIARESVAAQIQNGGDVSKESAREEMAYNAIEMANELIMRLQEYRRVGEE